MYAIYKCSYNSYNKNCFSRPNRNVFMEIIANGTCPRWGKNLVNETDSSKLLRIKIKSVHIMSSKT